MSLTATEATALFERAINKARNAIQDGTVAALEQALAFIEETKTTIRNSTIRQAAKDQFIQELDVYAADLNNAIERQRSNYYEATSKFNIATNAAKNYIDSVNANINPNADPARILSQLQDARATIQNSGLSDSEKTAKITEIDNLIAEVNRAAGRPVVAPSEVPTTSGPTGPVTGVTGPTGPADDTVENPTPPEIPPEQLTGEGYRVPTDEELAILRPPDYGTTPAEVAPEQLTGAGYAIPPEPDGPLLLTPESPQGPGLGDILGGALGAAAGAAAGAIGGALGAAARGLFGGTSAARSSAFIQDQYRTNSLKDWRVRLSLAPDSKYLYNAESPGILAPLRSTNGVVFPYTPQVQTTYAANYDAVSPTHSNYKIYQYGTSMVDTVTITCDFTAQDTFEANYLLAVIHFFKSVTKMFYGKDENPKAGTPPPLVFIDGLGAFQFNKHPLVINNFTYTLPNDVDYIRSYLSEKSLAAGGTGSNRLGTTLRPGGLVPKTVFGNDTGNPSPTYVPTRIQLQISAYPIVTRNRISNEFSLQKYGSGELSTKGIW